MPFERADLSTDSLWADENIAASSIVVYSNVFLGSVFLLASGVYTGVDMLSA